MNIILFPCQYGNLKEIDEDYKLEYQCALNNGFDIVLFNYDDFILFNKPLKLNKNLNLEKEINVIYRGWMLNSCQYEKFYNELLKCNLRLINNPTQYRNCHEFPYSYDKLKQYTPKCVYYKKNEKIDWDYIKNNFNKFFIKDFVKSVKGFDFPLFFDKTYTSEELDKFVQQFINIRGDLYTGGIVIKEFVDLNKENNLTHEFRCFYYKGKVLILYHNSDNLEDILPLNFVNNIPRLDSNFYTIDFAILNNGEIIVIETGDGFVSGISNELVINDFYKSLKELIKENNCE